MTVTPAAAPSPVASTKSFAALRHPGYRAFFIGSALAMMADSIEHVISYWIMFQKFQSPALGGFAVLSHWVPFLFFSVWVGALADRFDPRRLIQLGLALFMAITLLWGILFVTDTLEMWHAAVLLIAHGFAGVLWVPAGQLLLHDIVGPAQLQSAVRLLAIARYLGLLVGPALGGALLLALGPWLGIMANAVIYLPFCLWLWKAPYGPRFRTGDAKPPRAIRGLDDIISTIRAVAGDRTIMSMIVLSGCTSFIVGNAYHAQMPEYAHELGHGEAGLFYTMLLAADAAGAMLAGVVLESRGLLPPRPRTAFILAAIWCLALGAFAMSSSYPVSLGLLFVAGFMELSFYSMAQTLVQLNAPAEIRGRVIGVYSMSALGLRAFSGVTIGIVGGIIGIHWSLAISTMVLLAVILAMLSFTLIRGRGMPS